MCCSFTQSTRFKTIYISQILTAWQRWNNARSDGITRNALRLTAECRETFSTREMCLLETLLLFTDTVLRETSRQSLRKTYGRKICPQSCSLACGITGKSSEAASQSLHGAQRLDSYSQMNPDIHSEHTHVHTTACRAGTLNLSWNHKYTHACFSLRSADQQRGGTEESCWHWRHTRGYPRLCLP